MFLLLPLLSLFLALLLLLIFCVWLLHVLPSVFVLFLRSIEITFRETHSYTTFNRTPSLESIGTRFGLLACPYTIEYTIY